MLRNLSACGVLTVLTAAPALAQQRIDFPKVELGGQFTFLARADAESPRTVGPRGTINLSNRTAFDLTFERELGTRSAGDAAWLRLDLFSVQFRRSVLRSSEARLSVAFGASGGRLTEYSPAFAIASRDFPAERQTKKRGALFGGVGFDRVLTRHAALHVEAQVMLLSEPDFPSNTPVRLSAGLTVPLTAYPPRPATERLAEGGVMAHKVTRQLGRVRAGRKVWVTTTDGAEVAGEVLSIEPGAIALALRDGTTRSVAIPLVRSIEGPDSIKNGARVGALIGLGAGAVPAAIFSGMYGEGSIPAIIPLFGAIGAGVGALAGALGDSMREHREILYASGGGVSVNIAGTPGGIGLLIRWAP